MGDQDGGVGGGGGQPKFGIKKILFRQTSRDIRSVDIFLEEGRTCTLYFLTVFCFSCTGQFGGLEISGRNTTP